MSCGLQFWESERVGSVETDTARTRRKHEENMIGGVVILYEKIMRNLILR